MGVGLLPVPEWRMGVFFETMWVEQAVWNPLCNQGSTGSGGETWTVGYVTLFIGSHLQRTNNTKNVILIEFASCSWILCFRCFRLEIFNAQNKRTKNTERHAQVFPNPPNTFWAGLWDPWKPFSGDVWVSKHLLARSIHPKKSRLLKDLDDFATAFDLINLSLDKHPPGASKVRLFSA